MLSPETGPPSSYGKSKERRALTFVELLKVDTGGHFQDSKFMII